MTAKSPALVVRTGLVKAAYVTVTAVILMTTIPSLMAPGGYVAVDYTLYMEATSRWLEGGEFYEPYQLAGPYAITPGDVLYPPVVLWLLVPFTILPAVLWWVVPIGLTAWSLARLRPAFIAWPLMALCLAWPPTLVKLTTGNPVIWAVAAMAVGVVTVGPAVFVLIKPSLAPFALWGIWHRRWWVYLAAFALLSLSFGSMWLHWLRTVTNSQGGGLLYSVQEIPMLLLPVIAWWFRRQPPSA